QARAPTEGAADRAVVGHAAGGGEVKLIHRGQARKQRYVDLGIRLADVVLPAAAGDGVEEGQPRRRQGIGVLLAALPAVLHAGREPDQARRQLEQFRLRKPCTQHGLGEDRGRFRGCVEEVTRLGIDRTGAEDAGGYTAGAGEIRHRLERHAAVRLGRTLLVDEHAVAGRAADDVAVVVEHRVYGRRPAVIDAVVEIGAPLRHAAVVGGDVVLPCLADQAFHAQDEPRRLPGDILAATPRVHVEPGNI